MENILITGSRKIKNRIIVYHILDENIPEGSRVINGGAEGVDSLSLDWCNQSKKNLNWTTIKPIKSQKEYYLYRNAEMIGMCDRVIAIWDGKSRGTKFTIDYAKARNIPVIIFNEQGEIRRDM